MKNKRPLLLLLLLTLGCASNNQLQPYHDRSFKDITQGINDSRWEDLSLWPKTIRNENFEYRINTTGCVQSINKSVNNENGNCVAHYELITENNDYKKEDFYFGPFFVWRSDGSILYKSIIDEQRNSIGIRYYENDIIAQIGIYYHKIDLDSSVYFSEKMDFIGYSIVQYANSSDRKVKKVYFWKDQFLSENEFKKKKCVFFKKLRNCACKESKEEIEH